jgi:hypothetical protein
MPETPLPELPKKFRLTPEFELLVACSWIAPPAQAAEQLQKIASLCSGEIDWDEFVGLVRRHGVSALAYTMLCRHAGGLLPDKIKDSMRVQHIQMSGQALRQTGELVRIGKFFSDQGVPIIPLKGALLSQVLYGNPAMRESSDIDILVQPEYIDQADYLLTAEGYQCEYSEIELTEKQKKHLHNHAHHFGYFHKESGFVVELHFRSFLWTPEQTAELWKNCQSINFMKIQFSSLSDDCLLLYLCEHGARHEWFCLKWLGDVAVLFSQDRKVDWIRFFDLAERLDLTRVLVSAALIVHWLYNIQLPEPLCRLIQKEQNIVELCSLAVNNLIVAQKHEGVWSPRLTEAMRIKKLKPSLPYIMILKEFSIGPEDFKTLSLPDKWFWLYYPLRPFTWILRKIMWSVDNNRITMR